MNVPLAGLSRRIERTLTSLLPTPPAQDGPKRAIDLSSAQNEVIWPELLEFYKSVVEANVTSKVGSHRSATVGSTPNLLNRCSHYPGRTLKVEIGKREML